MAETTKSPSEELLENAQKHFDRVNNPHKVTSDRIYGLWNVENTSDANKPVSDALQAELDSKFSISEIYNKSLDDGTQDLTKFPWSAAQGKILNDTIDGLSDTSVVDEISDRITAVENILTNN